MSELSELNATLKAMDDRMKKIEDSRGGKCHGPDCTHATPPEKQAEALKPLIAAEVERCVGDACKKIEATNAEGVNALRATIHAAIPDLQRAGVLKKAAAAQGGEVKFWPCPSEGCGAALTGFERWCPGCGQQLEWPAQGQAAQTAQ